MKDIKTDNTRRKSLKGKLTFGTAIIACSIVLCTAPSFAQDAPPASVASPDVYKVIAENDQFRVIKGTWQPGQEDNFHSHPADRVSIRETDCMLRLTNSDGTSKDVKPKAGSATVFTGKPVKSHKAKNIGDKVCIVRIVELK